MEQALNAAGVARARFDRLGAVVPLLVEGEVLLGGRGMDLVRSRDQGASFERVASLPGHAVLRAAALLRPSARLLRAGLHGLCRTPQGGLVAVVRGSVMHAAADGSGFREAHRVTRGTRPLNVAADRHGVFFGEYFSNPHREAVRIYGSEDGAAFAAAHTFPAGAVRHVHGIWPDPYRGGLWALTGDHDHECGLWFTDDGFRTLERVAGGSQRARAVCVLPEEDGLVVPTDTPRERNFIQWFDPSDGSFTELAPAGGSFFHGTRGERVRLLSTVVERSEVNPVDEVFVYASRDGRRWREIARLGSDLLGGKRGRWFRYPQVTFAQGAGGGHVYGGAVSLRGLDGRLMRWSEEALVAALEEAGA